MLSLIQDTADALANTIDARSVARKFVQVKLTTSLPRMHLSSTALQRRAQTEFKDKGIRAKVVLFSDPGNPMRVVANAIGACYRDHMTLTNPFVDRGPRLLATSIYDTYRTRMANHRQDIENALRTHLQSEDLYAKAVQLDIGYRNALAATPEERVAKESDYPTFKDVSESFRADFQFYPVPDHSHFGDVISEEDKATLTAHLEEVAESVRKDMIERMREPAVHLLDKLRKELKTEGSVFRDSAVDNLREAVELVRQMAMGDPGILEICDMVGGTAAVIAASVDSLRESPVVRDAAAKKLAAVEAKMAAFFGG